MKRRYRAAVAYLVVTVAMVTAFVFVGAQPAVAFAWAWTCEGPPYVYKNVTVYTVHKDGPITCHDTYAHGDVLVDQRNAGHQVGLTGWDCSLTVGVVPSKIHVTCHNGGEHNDQHFQIYWLKHPPTTCPAAALTPASSRFHARSRGLTSTAGPTG